MKAGKTFIMPAVLALVVLIVVALFWVLCRGTPADGPRKVPEVLRSRRIRTAEPAAKAKSAVRRSGKNSVADRKETEPASAKKKKPEKKGLWGRGKPAPDPFAGFEPADRKLAEAVQVAADEDDYRRTVTAARKALGSSNPEVRKHALEALSGFGAQAVPEIIGSIADSDPGVAKAATESALQAFESAVEDSEIAQTAKLLMQTTSDTEVLSEIGQQLVSMDDNALLISTLTDVISTGTAAAQAEAKSRYQWLTGDEWTGADAAQKWLAEGEAPAEPAAVQNAGTAEPVPAEKAK